MKVIFSTSSLVSLVLLAAPALAGNPDAECRQEAELYGVPQEQFEEYVTGCVLSRGGNPAAGFDSGDAAAGAADGMMESVPVDEEQAGVVTGEEGGYGAQ